ncbi:hypothetical protein [Butyrivibrio sp. AE3004]|uniref:hypothetical protein n=1 Tax=Butyrivibrio sp. AE3004 TaxID=1506994 RepID=UPI0004944788|nr:hypothetical protein [Butyrivibrio sp. AE3004]
MRNNNNTKNVFAKEASPKIIDTVRFNNRYIDTETVKEKATGIISFSILAGLVAASFLFFI